MTAARPDLAVVQPGPETALDCRARICNEGRRKMIRLAKEAAAVAVEIGTELIVAKEELGHGNWEAWCGENLIFSKRTAERYMYVAGSPIAKSATVADLTLAALEHAERTRRRLERDKATTELKTLIDPLTELSLALERLGGAFAPSDADLLAVALPQLHLAGTWVSPGSLHAVGDLAHAVADAMAEARAEEES